MKERLLKLLKWAEETHRSAPNNYYRRYYDGYVQAVKDALGIVVEDADIVLEC